VDHFLSGEEFFARFNFRRTPDIFLVDSLIYDQQGNLLTSGVEIVSRLKARKRFENVPVIMMSTTGDEREPSFAQLVGSYYYQQKINGLMAGAADVIYKPHGLDTARDPASFPIEELVHKIRILSQSRILQQELGRANRQLRRKNRELAALNRNYLNVLSFVSHEFRNSLVIIGGFLRRLSRSITGGRQRRDMDTIIANCEFMEDMIDRYLILSRIEMGRLRLNPVDVDNFHEAVIKPVFQRLWKEAKKIEFVEDGELKMADLRCRVDTYLLQVVFSNLFNNAIKYGRPGVAVRYGAAREGDGYRFHVWNAGMGIEADKLKRVFHKFHRLQDKNIPEQKGIGLGLYNVKQIVELHGGRIWVESDYGHWVDFIFWLPAEPPVP
jgi:signal transduction histidine kinase